MSILNISRRALLRGGIALVGEVGFTGCGEPALRLPPGRPWVPPRPPTPTLPGGVGVTDGHLVKNGRRFFMHGFNHWSAPTMARDGNGAGWDDVRHDLDDLQAIGTNAIRVMCGSEGMDTPLPRINPSLQPRPGELDPAGVAGLLRLVDELQRRDMVAILTLSNLWPWSGGLGQYLVWAGGLSYDQSMPLEANEIVRGSWERMAERFFSNAAAQEGYDRFVRLLVPQLCNSRAVIWELCNQPRGYNDGKSAYQAWIARAAALVKSLAPAQLLTSGSDGQAWGMGGTSASPVRDHESQHIDFMTFHLWPERWVMVDPGGAPMRNRNGWTGLTDRIRRLAGVATKMQKPIVLEAFAYQRDGRDMSPDSETTLRDHVFDQIYATCHEVAATTVMAGLFPWAWSGRHRPPRPGEGWRRGDPFTGDPPDEPQGWHSIYRRDRSTLAVIRRWAAQPIIMA